MKLRFYFFMILCCSTMLFTSCTDKKQVLVDKIEQMEGTLFDSEEATFDEEQAQKLVSVYEEFYTDFPEDPRSAEFLFRAADLSKGLQQHSKAVVLYEMLIDKYPNYERSPLALFLKAFIYENDIGDFEKAKVYYELFLEKYPKHEMAGDARFSLNNLGKSPEELMKEWQIKEENM